MDATDQVLREPAFEKQLEDVFPELAYFGKDPISDPQVKQAKQETKAALLVLYWLMSDQFEAFVRGQPSDKKLSEKSWSKIMDLHRELQPEHLGAVMVCAALQGLSKIPKFRSQLAPHAKEGHEVLAPCWTSVPKCFLHFSAWNRSRRTCCACA
jgi:hypothetical protein